MKRILFGLITVCLLTSCKSSGNSGQKEDRELGQKELFSRYGISLDDGLVYTSVDEIEELKESYRSATDLYGLHIGKKESFIFKVENLEFKVEEDSGCGMGDALLVFPEYSCITFLSGLPSYNMEKQKTIFYHTKVDEDGKEYGYPFVYLELNKEHTFLFNGAKYALYATSYEDDDSYEAVDYKIYLKRESDGMTQLLTHIDQLEHKKPWICFAGDIDGDGKLDLLIDERRNYEHYKMKLFLSSFAEEGEFVKGVAVQEEWRGC